MNYTQIMIKESNRVFALMLNAIKNDQDETYQALKAYWERLNKAIR